MESIENTRKFLFCLGSPFRYIIPNYISLYMGALIFAFMDVLSGIRAVIILGVYTFEYSYDEFLYDYQRDPEYVITLLELFVCVIQLIGMGLAISGIIGIKRLRLNQVYAYQLFATCEFILWSLTLLAVPFTFPYDYNVKSYISSWLIFDTLLETMDVLWVFLVAGGVLFYMKARVLWSTYERLRVNQYALVINGFGRDLEADSRALSDQQLEFAMQKGEAVHI